MPSFIFTFPIGDELRRDNYFTIVADDEVEARVRVIDRLGRGGWAGCYPESDPKTLEMIEKYSLKEIEFK